MLGIVLSILAVVLAPGARAGTLANGDFEFECACPWQARATRGGNPPEVAVNENGACSYLLIDTVPAGTDYAGARQVGFTVDVEAGEWVVVEFDGAYSGDHLDTRVTLAFDGMPGALRRFVQPFGAMHRRVIAQQIAEGGAVTASIFFEVVASGSRMQIDNVVCSTSKVDPCPSPFECLLEATSPSGVGAAEDVALSRSMFGFCHCTADFDGNDHVGIVDLLEVLGAWSAAAVCREVDLDCDGAVGPGDLSLLVARWGPCPGPP